MRMKCVARTASGGQPPVVVPEHPDSDVQILQTTLYPTILRYGKSSHGPIDSMIGLANTDEDVQLLGMVYVRRSRKKLVNCIGKNVKSFHQMDTVSDSDEAGEDVQLP